MDKLNFFFDLEVFSAVEFFFILYRDLLRKILVKEPYRWVAYRGDVVDNWERFEVKLCLNFYGIYEY